VWTLAAGKRRWSLLLLLFSGWRGWPTLTFVTSSSSASASILVVVVRRSLLVMELDFCRGNHDSVVDAGGDFCFSAHLNALKGEKI